MSGRSRLPDRRRAVTRHVAHRDHRFVLTIGFDGKGSAREVFASGAKEGSDMQALISDACVVVSIALQHGVGAGELARSLGRVAVPWATDGRDAPASPIGVIVAAVLEAGP